MTVEPAGAESWPLNGSPVDVSVPPKAISGELDGASIPSPLEPVTVEISPGSRIPFPFLSAKIVAPVM